jgi:GT2 family glycosyltransferase
LSGNNNIAAVSPHILTMDNKSWFSGGIIDWRKCEILNTPEVVNPNEVRKVDIFNGCAVLINAKKFFESGMFKIDLFLYYDEAFLSMCFLETGGQCFYHPNLTAYHRVSYGIGSNSTLGTYYMNRNHIYFFKKYNKKKTFLCPYIDVFKTFLSHVRHFRMSNVYYLLLAVYDAIRGKKGIL